MRDIKLQAYMDGLTLQAREAAAKRESEVYALAYNKVREFLKNNGLPDFLKSKSFYAGSRSVEPSSSHLFYITYDYSTNGGVEASELPVAVLSKDGSLFFLIDPKNKVNIS